MLGQRVFSGNVGRWVVFSGSTHGSPARTVKMHVNVSNITSVIKDFAIKSPGRNACKFGATDVSFSKLDQLVSRIVTWLFEHGVKEGDVVALRFSQQIKLVPALLAVMRIGAAGMVVAPVHSSERRRHLLDQAGIKILISDTGSLLQARFVGLVLPSWSNIASFARSEWTSQNPDLICSIIVGSGSTGEPKLLPMSHRTLASRTEIRQNILQMRGGEQLMLLSPPQFASFFEYSLAAILHGATSTFWNQKGSIIEAIRLAKPDVVHLTAFHAQKLALEASFDIDFSLSNIRLITVSSSPVSDALRGKLINDFGANLRVVYGSNETGPLTATNLHHKSSVQNSIGLPLEKVTLEIVSEDGVPTPSGEIGQIRVKSPGAISEYFKNKTETNFRSGWFYPRDLAFVSEDQQLVFMGRSDHLMIFDGINIFPSQIENALDSHDAVAESAAFSVPNDVHGDIPLCAVVLSEDCAVTVSELSTFAREKLGICAPRRITILEEIPRTRQGKIDRQALTELAGINSKFNPSAAKAEPYALPYPAKLLQQPHQCRVLRRLRVVAPDKVAFKYLASWEKHLFDSFSPRRYRDVNQGIEGTDKIVVRWIQFVQKITAFLLIQSCIPCFDPILLSDIKKREGTEDVYDVIFEHPQFLNYKPGTFSEALREAFSAAHFMRTNPASARNREVFWSEVSNRAIPRIASDNVTNNSTIQILYEAYKKRIPFVHLGGGVYQLGWGAASRLISASTTEFDSRIGAKLAGTKHITAAVLRQAGLPAPKHYVISRFQDASVIAERLGYPVVVKPTDLERGEGISFDVTSTELQAAVLKALALSPSKKILIEKQVPGVCHRLFVADGRLLYAVKRLPIGVYGDGKLTIEAIVKQTYSADLLLPPWERSKIRPIDNLARVALSKKNLSPMSIPERGQFAPLRQIESTEEGGIDEDVSEIVHPENAKIAIEAARLLGLTVCGIDLITEDISRPWMETGAIINEANYSPSLGSGEISRQHLGPYVDHLLGGSGRIPVEVFVGQDGALAAGLTYIRSMKNKGIEAFLVSDAQTLNSFEKPHHLAVDTVSARVRALVSSKSVEALAIVVQSTLIASQPLPLEYVDSVHWIEDPFEAEQSGDFQIRIATLRDLLDRWQFNALSRTAW